MSIVVCDEALKSLVVVPWKSTGLFDALDIGRTPDGRADELQAALHRSARF